MRAGNNWQTRVQDVEDEVAQEEVSEPWIRARLGTTAHFCKGIILCKVVVVKINLVRQGRTNAVP